MSPVAFVFVSLRCGGWVRRAAGNESNPGNETKRVPKNKCPDTPPGVSAGVGGRIVFKLALVQMRVDGGRKDENLRRADERIAEAAARGADVILLPEAMDLGWTHPSARRETDPDPDASTCRRLRDAARRHRRYVCS